METEAEDPSAGSDKDDLDEVESADDAALGRADSGREESQTDPIERDSERDAPGGGDIEAGGPEGGGPGVGDAGGEEEDDEDDASESLGTRSELEVIDACKRRIRALVPAAKVREEIDKNYRELASTIQLPGFRKGRVPRKLLEARFGAEIEADVKDALLSVSFSEVVEERDLKVIGSPKFDAVSFAPGSDLQYEVEVELKPEFDLGQYKGIEVTIEDAPVTDEEVEDRLKFFQLKSAEYVPTDIASAGPDDVMAGHYELYHKGASIKSGMQATFKPSSGLLDSFSVKDLPERFAAWDRSAGSPLKLEFEVHEEHPEKELRGEHVTLEFSPDEATRRDVPALDDELAKRFGKDTLAELRDAVRRRLEEESQREREAKVGAMILEKIGAETEVALPQGIIETAQKSRNALRARREELLKGGFPSERVDELLAEIEPEAAQGEDEAASDVRRSVKEFFILEKIAEVEKIFATEDEVRDRLKRLAVAYGESPARTEDEMRSSGRLEDLRVSIRHEKVRAFLRKAAKITDRGARRPEVERADREGKESAARRLVVDAAAPDAPSAAEPEGGARPRGAE
ncbi:MAG TPA: trigger factor [Planctomycetota bacterium]|nr:trigger factor [Planctomycetota bacterium]